MAVDRHHERAGVPASGLLPWHLRPGSSVGLAQVGARRGTRRWLIRSSVLTVGLVLTLLLGLARSAPPAVGAQGPARVFLPTAIGPPVCQGVSGQSYGTTPVYAQSFNAAAHPDLNLALRGYVATSATRGLVDYNGGSDGSAPQLPGLFADGRTPVFRSVYRVYDWDWVNNRRGAPLTTWPATLLGLASTPGELVRVPESGYTIGGSEGYDVLVLYAEESRITLKYTRDDNVRTGYTLHVEGVCVEPGLLALYRSSDAAGRSRLPGLHGLQVFGQAANVEVGVAIRDCGSFMDPRSRKDWWRGR